MLLALTTNELVVSIQYRYEMYEIGIAVCERYRDLPNLKQEFSPGIYRGTQPEEAHAVAAQAFDWLCQYIQDYAHLLPTQQESVAQAESVVLSALDNEERMSQLQQMLPGKVNVMRNALIAVGGEGERVAWLDDAIEFVAAVLSRYGAAVRFSWKDPGGFLCVSS